MNRLIKCTVSAIVVLITALSLPAAEYKNIDYAGTGKTQHLLDIYTPGSGSGPFPVVIYYPGLAFSWSNAKTDGGLKQSFNAAGFAVVGANLSGGGSGSNNANYPTQIQELKATVRFLRANAEKYNLDPNFIGVTGMSSGGWNAVMLATTGDVKEYTVGNTTMDLEGNIGGNLEYSSRVQAAWASCPPTDFSIMNNCTPKSMLDHEAANSPEGGIIGGRISQNPDKVALANPVTFVSKDDPPLYLRHGTADNIVPPCQSEVLWEAIQEVGNEKDMNYTPQQGGSHAEFGSGRLEFFQRALANNKEGCLDPHNANFDPLATYCSTGDCCNKTRTAYSPSATKQRHKTLMQGLDLVNTSGEAIVYKIFDVAGHLVTTGRLAPNRRFSLRETGSGLRLCELRVRGATVHGKVICP